MIGRLPPPFSTFARMFAMPFLTMASTAQSFGNSAMSSASNMIPSSVRSGMDSNMMRQRPWGGPMGGMGQGGPMGGMGQGGPMGGMGQGGPMGQMGGMMGGGRPGMMGQGMGGMGQGMGGMGQGMGGMGQGMGGMGQGMGQGMNPAIGQAVSMMSQYIQSPEGQQMIQMARVALAHASRAFMESILQQTSGQQSMGNNNSMSGSSSMGGQLGGQFGQRPMGGPSSMGQPSMGQSSGQGSMQTEDQNSMGMRSAVGTKSDAPKVESKNETPKA